MGTQNSALTCSNAKAEKHNTVKGNSRERKKKSSEREIPKNPNNATSK